MYKSLIFMFCVFTATLATKPSYIHPCSRSAANFRECCIQHGNDALPSLFKGDRKYNIPMMLPLELPEVRVDSGPNLKITLYHVKLHGLDTAKLTDFSINFDTHKVAIEVLVDRVMLIGDYDVDGKIMILPIQGKGVSNITAVGGVFKYEFGYALKKKNAIEYAEFQTNDKLTFKLQKAHIHFENLFNGDATLGNNVNTFLNENWEEVINEMGGAIEGTIKAVARNIAQNVFNKIPFNELFLD